MPIRSPKTTRNHTRYPVEIGATQAILGGLPDTDSLIELPNVNTDDRAAARDFILDIMQDIHMALEESGDERFYWAHSTLETAFSRSLDLKDPEEVLAISAQLPATAWQGQTYTGAADEALANQSAGEYLEAITRRVLLGIRHLMWECAAALIWDGVLTWNGHHLVWNYGEVLPAWRDQEGNR